MTRKHRPSARRPRPLHCAIAVSLALASLTAAAQSAAPAPTTAEAAAQRAWDLPAAPLADTLARIARNSGQRLSADPALVAGKTAAPVRGRYSPTDAARQALAGTGLELIVTESGTLSVRPAPVRKGDATLAAVTVTAQAMQEQATGPVLGYVAKRSMTAMKTDTPIIETPMSINIVTREQMDSQGVQQVVQALRYTPGVAADIRGNISRFDQMAFRGIGFALDSFHYLDGLRLPRGASYLIPQIDTHSVERVEVFKGPASLLYGQAPLGGIVNLVSKRPTEESLHEVSMSLGSHQRRQITWDSGGALDGDGTLSYRLTALARKANTSVQMTEEERFYIAPSIAYKPNTDTSLTVFGLYQHDPTGGFYGTLPSSGTILPNPYGKLSPDFFDGSPDFNAFDRTQASIGYELKHRFNERWSLTQNMRYWRMDLDQSQVGQSGLQADYRTLSRYALWSREKMNAVNIDTHLQGDLQTGPLAHRLLIGLDLQRDRWTQTQGFGAAPTLDILTPDYGQAIMRPAASTSPDRTQRLIGLYVQDQIKWGGWGLTLGSRFDRVNIENDNRLASTHTDQNISKFTWRAALMHNFDNGVAPYASYATSFDPSVTVNPYGDPFKPTTGRQYEVGLKYQPPGTDALFTLSAFDLVQQNVLTSDPRSSLPNARVQTGEVTSRGLEFEARFSPVKGLNVVGGLAAINPKVTRSNGTDLGKRTVSVAHGTASLWADYRLGGALAGLTVGGGVRVSGSAYADAANTQKIPGYGVADAMLRYELGRISPGLRNATLALNLNNIFDKAYFTCNAANFCNYGQDRTFLATLKYGW